MTTAEISSYELAYQIRFYMSVCKMEETQFADLIPIPHEEFRHFMEYQNSELSVRQISKICDLLHISMDSLVRGPVEEQNFILLLKKCAFAVKFKGTFLYNICIFFLKRWKAKRISDSCLKRYTQWFIYLCSPHDAPLLNMRTTAQPISSAVCFTRHISPKQRKALENMIEESKKK